MPDVPFEFTKSDADFIDGIDQRLMGASREFRRQEISDLVGVDAADTRRVWRALGFANSRDAALAFTKRDVEALQSAAEMATDLDIDIDTLLGLARALGRTTDRLAMWETQLVADMIQNRSPIELDGKHLAKATAEEIVTLADRLEPLMGYVWRRNLSVAAARMLADAQPEGQFGVVRTVGFADLVSFTQLSRTLSESALATLVTRFEAAASEIVSEHSGAVVKTVGDEVLFSHQEPEGAARIARALREMSEQDEVLPRMRVGLSTGRVLARLGDIYGTTVNRAARLTAAADAGEILIDEASADALRHDPESTLRAHASIELAGLGLQAAWVLV